MLVTFHSPYTPNKYMLTFWCLEIAVMIYFPHSKKLMLMVFTVYYYYCLNSHCNINNTCLLILSSRLWWLYSSEDLVWYFAFRSMLP